MINHNCESIITIVIIFKICRRGSLYQYLTTGAVERFTKEAIIRCSINAEIA